MVFVKMCEVFRSNHLDVTEVVLADLEELVLDFSKRKSEGRTGSSNAAMFNALVDELYSRLVGHRCV